MCAEGDLLGPSISGLDSLVQMPYGCGEQNMIHFAPNVYVLRYLSTRGPLDPALQNRAIDYMLKGGTPRTSRTLPGHDPGREPGREPGRDGPVLRQVMSSSCPTSGPTAPSAPSASRTRQAAPGRIQYRDRTRTGPEPPLTVSLRRLTAFVLRCLLQARPWVGVDGRVLESAAAWLAAQRAVGGAAAEPGTVIHSELQGGLDGPVSLTAYVLVALLEDAYIRVSGSDPVLVPSGERR